MLWYFCQACDEYLPLAGKPARTNNTRAQTGSGGKFGQCHHRWVVQYPGHPTLVSGHTGHCQEPHNEPGLTIATFFPATRWLWRERRGGGGSGAARAQQVSTRAGAAAAAARASQVSWKKGEKILTKNYVSRRQPGQPEILDNKPGGIAPRARQWLAESVSAGVSFHVTRIILVTVMCSGLSWCWVTLRSCVTITSMWCCPKWRLQSTTQWSCGEYLVTQTQTSNLFLQNIFLSSTWTLLAKVEEAITVNIYSFSWTQSGALSWINEWIEDCKVKDLWESETCNQNKHLNKVVLVCSLHYKTLYQI